MRVASSPRVYGVSSERLALPFFVAKGSRDSCLSGCSSFMSRLMGNGVTLGVPTLKGVCGLCCLSYNGCKDCKGYQNGFVIGLGRPGPNSEGSVM